MLDVALEWSQALKFCQRLHGGSLLTLHGPQDLVSRGLSRGTASRHTAPPPQPPRSCSLTAENARLVWVSSPPPACLAPPPQVWLQEELQVSVWTGLRSAGRNRWSWADGTPFHQALQR